MFDPSFDITKPPPPVDDTFPHVKLLEQLRQSDEILVQQFLSSRTLKTSNSEKITKRSSSVIITAFRTELHEALQALEALKRSKQLIENRQDGVETEQIKHLQNTVEDRLKKLEKDGRLAAITRKLAVRKKKRAWQRRRKMRLKKAREDQQQERVRRSEEISRWENEWKARLAQERTAREELHAKTLVLADVRRRKARAKRYLSRFEKTIHLHQQRQNATKTSEPTAAQEGCVEDDSTETFRKKVHVLVDEWKSKLAECMREEKRLRDELTRRSAGNENRRRENRWRKALFGDAAALVTGRRGPMELQELIETRWSWDAYALPPTPHHDAGSAEAVRPEKGYSVPTGWVVPPENPLPEWAAYREPMDGKSEKIAQ